MIIYEGDYIFRAMHLHVRIDLQLSHILSDTLHSLHNISILLLHIAFVHGKKQNNILGLECCIKKIAN
jgi:hypothetical protein